MFPFLTEGIDDLRVAVLAEIIKRYGPTEIILSFLWEWLLITNGIEGAKFASKTLAIETLIFMDYIKEVS